MAEMFSMLVGRRGLILVIALMAALLGAKFGFSFNAAGFFDGP